MTSIDFIARHEGCLSAAKETQWDLIVVDEAHKLSAYEYGTKVERSDRYQAIEALVPRTDHLLFLTATPHRGRKDTFRRLLMLLDLVKELALKAIAGEFTGDALSRLYFVWANLYGTSEQAWDDARLVVQIGGDTENAMDVARGRGLFVVDGARCRLSLLRDRSIRRNLGADPDSPLIDQLHRAMHLWDEERRSELVTYLREHDLIDHAPFWKLAQALFEVLPRGEEDWKLISALLGERETLRLEARRTAPPTEQTLFDV